MMPSNAFAGKTLVVAVTGGVAAYRACDLIRELYRRGAARVIPIMTPSAERFIAPLTLHSLSKEAVFTSDLDVDSQGVPWHIALAQQADALIVHPCTTNTLAKFAHGMADNMVTTTFMTFTGKPVLIVPAMNTRMWRHPLTQENLRKLQCLDNVTVVQPTSGLLACGETGDGHLADQETVLTALYKQLHPQAGLYEGVKALVTAGGTQEAIDPVRLISNRSSGKMGLAMADELHAMGAEVTLISTRPVERPYSVLPAETAARMQAVLYERFETADFLVMAAAVSDYTVAAPSAEKIKRVPGQPLSLELTPTADILAGLAARKRPGQFVVGFAAESQDLLENAQAKLTRKHLDALLANDISRADIGFESDENELTLLLPDTPPELLPKASKAALAQEALVRIRQRMAAPATEMWMYQS